MGIVQKMDHFTIVSTDLAATREFYGELGLTPGPRPRFRRDGLWLYAAGRAILHVIEVDAMPEPRRGVLDHMAFTGQGLAESVAWVAARGLAYRLQRAPEPFDIWQLFFPGPNGEEVELDFDPSETPPEGWRPGA